jgi:ferredoxin
MVKIVRVDLEECISCGLHVYLAPGVFRSGNGIPGLQPVRSIGRAEQACISGCPVESVSRMED